MLLVFFYFSVITRQESINKKKGKSNLSWTKQIKIMLKIFLKGVWLHVNKTVVKRKDNVSLISYECIYKNKQDKIKWSMFNNLCDVNLKPFQNVNSTIFFF